MFGGMVCAQMINQLCFVNGLQWGKCGYPFAVRARCGQALALKEWKEFFKSSVERRSERKFSR